MYEDLQIIVFGLIAVLVCCMFGGLIWASHKEVMSRQQTVAACVQLGNPIAECKELGKWR